MNLQELTNESLDLLRQMVAVPSESFQEDNVCALICDFLQGKGLDPKRVGNNIVCRNASYDAALPTLVLDAHIDTVPAASSYIRNPYDAGEDPERIWGLGSNDDGGCVVSMIAVFRYFYDRKLPCNLVLSLSCEEERSGPGGTSLLFGPDGPEETVNAGFVIVGEPTGMRAATSERGLLVLDAVAQGVSGHAARDEGVNALYIAVDDIQKLREHHFEKYSDKMGAVKLTVTQIQAGTAHNVVPDNCTFVVDVRPTEQYSNDEIWRELQALCRSKLTPRNLQNRSNATHDGSPLIEASKALGLEFFSSPTTSDWVRLGDRDAIKLGPGDSARSHHADEFILTEEIREAVKIYVEFCQKAWCAMSCR